MANEACTAPEMRWLFSRLGDLTGKRVLDVGCGIGEASVYFAVKGAVVTATDLSTGMLAVTQRLAERHGVKLRTHQANAETVCRNRSGGRGTDQLRVCARSGPAPARFA